MGLMLMGLMLMGLSVSVFRSMFATSWIGSVMFSVFAERTTLLMAVLSRIFRASVI